MNNTLYSVVSFNKSGRYGFCLVYMLCSLLLLSLSVILSCSPNHGLTGTSSGTEAKIAHGVILKEDGSVAENAHVKLIPADYNPVKDAPLSDSAVGITDANGRYELYASDTGVYNIQAVLEGSGSRLLIPEVHLKSNRTDVPESRLQKPGTIKVVLPEDADTVNGYLYLPGTDIAVSLKGKSGFVTIDSVPEAVFSTVLYSSVKSDMPVILENNVTVNSGETVVVVMPEWKYSRKVFLNTTATGAGVSGTVTEIPILLRFNGNNFDFNQALPGGADIRFTKTNGEPLPYEIEQWDAVTEQALIWVKLDSIYGDDSSQSIVMYWGNPEAKSKSDSRLVFDTADGFQGVWHLDDNGEQLFDVTRNRFHGVKRGNQARSSGVIGSGQSLYGSGDFTEMGDVCNPGLSDFTFTCWVKKAVNGKRQTIASKSTGGSASSTYGWLIELDPDGALFFFMATTGVSWGSPGTFVIASNKWITDTSWHYIAVVIDRSGENKSRIYIDGNDVSALPADGVTTVSQILNTMPLRLGADANGGNPWTGSLDECSIAFRVRSKDWVRLSYMNQKLDDRLIEFR